MATEPAADAPDEDRRPGRRASPAVRRREREQAIIAATRELFDNRGVRDAQIDDIARAVGVNRAIIYRHFTGKEELFGLTVADYLDELADRLRDADDPDADAVGRLRRLTEAFHDFGIAYPAFVDCAQMLMRNTGRELFEEINEHAVLRLGRAIAACLGRLVEVLQAGIDSGDFHVHDPHLLANTLYAQGLGALQLARVGLLVKESAPGVPTVAPLSADRVRRYLVAASVAMAVGIGDEDPEGAADGQTSPKTDQRRKRS